MASGFLVLPDGRCFSRRWSAHDVILRAVANELTIDSTELALRQWLLEQLPGPHDLEELGYGAWLRNSDQTIVERTIDLRQMTANNQRAFCSAAKRAALTEHEEEWLVGGLVELAEMVERYERGEPPLSKSDWRDVVPPEDEKIGPGWDSA